MAASAKVKYDWVGEYDVEKLSPDNIDRLSTSLVPPGTRVLELGCSTGYLTRYLTNRKQCSVVGVDINAHALKIASKYARQVLPLDLNDQTSWRNLKKLPLFDVVFAPAVIEHLIDPWTSLENIRSLLKPSGLLIITFPNIAHWRSRFTHLLGKWEYEDYGMLDSTHNKFFTLYSMRTVLVKAGFEILTEKYDPAGGAKFLTPLLIFFPNAYAYQVAILAQKNA